MRSWPALDIHPVSELLQAALVDYDVTAVDERAPDDWRVFFTSARERDRAGAALRTEFPDITVQSVDVPDENWAARSQASLRAVRVGAIVVAPPWDLPRDSSDGTIRIVVEPSMGFGTGHHATTRLCLAALQRLDLKERSVLDVGTGSGVLAIAASLLGSSDVTGIDDDADAVASAQKNLELNAGANVTLLVGDLRSTRLPAADVVVANLTGGLLVAAAGTIQSMATRGGRLILSGLMASEEQDVLVAFAGWIVEHRSDEDEWVALTLRGANS
ncbi:MAG TPA: 50S ribosomal protein L11 methyltransferase [Vicinamibacterales bacterium]|nr:50S ribosomal protein L11 methyltransferase [Vicinamibacterales bacterium]